MASLLAWLMTLTASAMMGIAGTRLARFGREVHKGAGRPGRMAHSNEWVQNQGLQ